MKKLKKIIAPLAFFLTLLFAACMVSDTLLVKREDGITSMKAFYDQPENTVDVLVLGSSHAGWNLSAQTLWDEYGIAGYVLWGPIQPFWNTYHFLVEALKTQTPKVIVLEVYAATQDFAYSDESRMIANLEGMRLSANKWQAIQVSAPPERWLDLLTVFPVVHARYGELTEKDFQYYPWNDLSQDKGSRTVDCSIAELQSIGDAATVSEVKPLYEKEQLYLDKIIALCRETNIPLVLLTTPTLPRERQQPYYNRVAQIAEENGLPYINCNLLDAITGFDFTTDFRSYYLFDADHLNTKGATRITRFLAKYLKENYELPDRRGDARYESWEAFARQTKNELMPQITDTADYFAELASSYYVYYLVKAYGRYEMSEGYTALIEQAAQIDDGAGHVAAVLKDEWGSDIAVQCAGLEEENWIHSDEEKAEMGFALDAENKTVLFNGEPVCRFGDDSIEMAVYDPYTKTCVDVVEFCPEEDYALKRVSLPDE